MQFASDGVLETINGGYFAQEQPGYKNFLFVTGGLRYDYSSAFGKTADGVLYPKVSVSFVPSGLAGFSMGPISSLRLRGTWGQSGRQPSAFAKFTTFGAQAGPAGAGLAPDNLGNPDLTPEGSTEIEGGLEIGLAQDRFGIEATYWKRRINDLLFNVQFPPSGGFTNAQLTNVGIMDGNGLELGVTGFVIQTPGCRSTCSRTSRSWIRKSCRSVAHLSSKRADRTPVSEATSRRGTHRVPSSAPS